MLAVFAEYIFMFQGGNHMLIRVLILLEILIINLLLTHILARKKYSNLKTFGILFLFTIVISSVFYFINSITGGDGQTVWFVLIGFLYIFPLYILYDTKVNVLITIMIYCWTYTMILNSISHSIGYLLSQLGENPIILITQTLLIIITFNYVLKFTKNKFMVIVENASNETRSSLILLGLCLFTTITSIRYFINPNTFIYYLLVLSLIIIVTTSYNLLFKYVETYMHLDNTKKIVYRDTLTGIANRYSLFEDINNHITNNQPFTLLFMDLDSLKKINDGFGHSKGDDYLRCFAKSLKNIIQTSGKSYRFAGDEFVCILPDVLEPIDVKQMEQELNKMMDEQLQFSGVSIGISKFPEDASTPDALLSIADKRMYGMKNSRKIRAN